jgi:hypothetical protein
LSIEASQEISEEITKNAIGERAMKTTESLLLVYIWIMKGIRYAGGGRTQTKEDDI